MCLNAPAEEHPSYVALAGLLAVFAKVVSPQPIFVALLTCVVIVGRPRLLGAWPLVLIGTYSYGLYLWHPLAKVVSDRLAVRIVFTIVVTILSFHLIEFPVRRKLSAARAISVMAVLSVVALIVVALLQPSRRITFLPTAAVVAASPAGSTPAPSRSMAKGATTTRPTTRATVTSATAPTVLPTIALTTTTTTSPPVPLRISAAGDSTQMFADAAWQAFAATYPQTVTWVKPPDDIVPWTSGADGWGGQQAADLGLALPGDGPQGGLDRQGCPMIYDLQIRAVDTLGFEDPAKLHSATPTTSCDWHQWIPAALAAMHLDVLVVSWAVTDMWQYELPDGSHGSVGDSEFDGLLAERMSEFEAMAAQYGTRVLWITYQPISHQDPPDRWTLPGTADLLAAVMLTRSCVSDLRSVVRSDPSFDWYQDGYHFSPAGAARAVAAIVPDVVACAAR